MYACIFSSRNAALLFSLYAQFPHLIKVCLLISAFKVYIYSCIYFRSLDAVYAECIGGLTVELKWILPLQQLSLVFCSRLAIWEEHDCETLIRHIFQSNTANSRTVLMWILSCYCNCSPSCSLVLISPFFVLHLEYSNRTNFPDYHKQETPFLWETWYALSNNTSYLIHIHNLPL